MVYEYISTGSPIGSKTIATRYRLGVSPATVRSTLAELEELGLAVQPHTSAGRVPTDLGIRVFVESLMELRELSPAEQGMIAGRIADAPTTGDTWREAGRLLSELSEHAAVVSLPGPAARVLAQLRFVPLPSGEALALIVGQSGLVLHTIVRGPSLPSEARLERIHNYLNELIPGRTLAEARAAVEAEIGEARRTLDALRTEALELVRGALVGLKEEPGLVVHGQARLVRGRASGDMDRVRHLMELLEDQGTLAELLDATLGAEGARVVIGAEHPATSLAHCSVVAATFAGGCETPGAIAVVGPRSMDYCKLLPLVEFAARVVSERASRAA